MVRKNAQDNNAQALDKFEQFLLKLNDMPDTHELRKELTDGTRKAGMCLKIIVPVCAAKLGVDADTVTVLIQQLVDTRGWYFTGKRAKGNSLYIPMDKRTPTAHKADTKYAAAVASILKSL